MSNNIILISLIIGIFTHGRVNSQVFEIAKTIGTGLFQLANIIIKANDFYESMTEESKSNLITDYSSLNETLNELQETVNSIQHEVVNFRIDIILSEVFVHIAFINRNFDSYSEYSTNSSQYSDVVKKEFSEKILRKMEDHIVPIDTHLVHGGTSLLSKMEKNIDIFDPFCESKKSRQQYFYDFYLKVMINKLKAFSLMEYAYDIIGDTKSDKKFSLKRMKDETYALDSKFKEVLRRAPREIWKCDGDKSKRKNHYFKLKNVFRMVFYKDYELDKKYGGECPGSCPMYIRSPQSVPKCYERDDCAIKQRICNNVVYCTPVYFGESYDVCVKKTSSGPRYASINNSDIIRRRIPDPWEEFKRLFRSSPTCNNDNLLKHVESIEGIYYGDGAVGHFSKDCAYCKCVCDETGFFSLRYFSLKPVTSDVYSNKVITGVKLVKQKNTVYIQIQQGKLLPGGFIDNPNTEWKPFEYNTDGYDGNDVSYDDYVKTYKNFKALRKIMKIPNEEYELMNGEDKFRLDWFEKRGLYLDDIDLPYGELITGVRFAVTKNESQYFIKLDVLSTPFNATSGLLLPTSSYWYSTVMPEYERTKLDLGGFDSPIHVKVDNNPDNEAHQYTFFTPSKILSKNAGQDVLPFLDAQEVTSFPAVPLSGISLDIKRGGDSGGYLIFKINTFDIMQLSDTQIFQEQYSKEKILN